MPPPPDQRAAELFRAALDGPREKLDAVILEANRWLADPAPERRKVGLEILGHVSGFRGYRPSPDMLRNIFDCARDAEGIVRAEAACALSLIPNAPDEQRAELLIKLLDDEHSLVREEAAAAIGDLLLARAAGALARHLEDQSEHVRVECAIALGMLKDGRAFEGLLKVLDRPWDRIGACAALVELGDPRAVPALQKLTSKWILDFNERLHALGALYRLGDRASGEEIIRRTRAWNRPERHVAMWMIGHARVEEGTQLLFEAARSKTHKMRDPAVRGLGELGGKEAIATLIAIAIDPSDDADTRFEAVAAAGELKGEDRARALGEIAAKADGEIAIAAREMMQDGTYRTPIRLEP